MEVFLWIFLNIVVAAAPVVVIVAARHFHNLPQTWADVLGDGFLYFFTVVLAAGLISDMALAAERNGTCPPTGVEVNGLASCVNPDYLVLVMIGGASVAAMTMVAYALALVRKFDDRPGNARRSAITSAWFAGAGTVMTLVVRFIIGLW